jgi:hypothetical protein
MAGPTEAVLFRLIDQEKPTVLFDEIDTVFHGGKSDERSEGMRGLLNSGFKLTGKIPRCVKVRDNHEPYDFSTFCPKVLAGIGKLPDTVEDRSIPIPLVRKTKSQKVERFRAREAEERARPIKEALEAWAGGAVIEELRRARPLMPEEGLTDRQRDICEPLLAIADLAGEGWPERARRDLVKIFATSEGETDSLSTQALRDIRRVFSDQELNRISTVELLNHLIDIAESPWGGLWADSIARGNPRGPAQRLASFLRPHRIFPKTYTFADGKDAKGYEEAAFADAWERYL